MDVGAFVQENKRWLIGCAAGAIVWLIAGTVVDSTLRPERLSTKQIGLKSQVYGKEALAAATAELEQLQKARAALQAELTFVPDKRYELDGKGAHDTYGYQTGLALKQAIAAAASERMVACSEAGITWEIPTTPDDTRGMLLGLAVLDELQKRLFAAHDAVKAERPDAYGLRAIVAMKLDARRGQRSAARAPRAGEVDLRDLLVQEQVSFTVQGDEATLLRLLESCRQPGRTLVVDGWQLVQPTRRGDPCTLKGTVLGVQFKDGARSETNDKSAQQAK